MLGPVAPGTGPISMRSPIAGFKTHHLVTNETAISYQSAECLTLAWRGRIPESAIA